MNRSTRSKLIWTHAWPLSPAGNFAENGEPGIDLGKELAAASSRLLKDLQEKKLPFVSLDYAGELVCELEELAPHLTSFTHLLLLGIGGSALGPRALQKAFYPEQDWPRHDGKCIWIADNVDPESLPQWLERLPPKETLVLAISKSGGTIETMGQYFLAKEWLQKALGPEYKKHLLLVTDKNSGFLRSEANSFGLRTLPVPPGLGGRYSVLSAVGLAPALFLGLNWKALLAGAQEVLEPLNSAKNAGEMVCTLESHPAWKLAVWARAMMLKGYSELIYFTYVPKLATFGPWFAQLWAESLGKNGKGSMPLPATGVTDQHSVQQMFLDGPKNKACIFVSSQNMPDGTAFPENLGSEWAHLEGKNLKDLLLAETMGTRMALSENKIPLLEIRLARPDEFNAGKLVALLGLATILTGWLMGINPLDQPAVELGKRLANASLGAAGLNEEKRKLALFKETRETSQDF